tara:strand:- start:610 stop:1536 length:927 start_codon:yes stop_codon:yes gene_type:complete
METGKTGKYLKYAIGEIILVVIGILIALQINNWNETRKDRIQEKKFLIRFEAEITTNIENINYSIMLNKSRMKRAEFLMKTIDSSQLAENSASYFIRSIEHAGYTFYPVISDNTFQEIKSSGKLSLISNVNIRSALQRYYSFWSSELGQYNFLREDTQLRYNHEKEGILSPRQQISMGSLVDSVLYNQNDGKQVFERMINKPGYLAMLPNIIRNQIETGESLENIKKMAIELRLMIQKELKNKGSNFSEKLDTTLWNLGKQANQSSLKLRQAGCLNTLSAKWCRCPIRDIISVAKNRKINQRAFRYAI